MTGTVTGTMTGTVSRTSMETTSPLLAQRTREKWGTRDLRSTAAFGNSTFKHTRFAGAIIRGCLLGLLLSFAGGMVAVRAQEAAAEPKHPKPEQDSAGQPGPGGAGRQLVHETREAAGEEADENVQFKQSASVQWIARHTGLDLRHAYWLSMAINFAVIAGVLFWVGRKSLPGIFRDRTAAIQKAMREAQQASEEARRKLADIEARLMKLDAEIGTIRSAAEKEGAAEEDRIKRAAEEDTRKIVASAEQEIATAAKAARRQLTAFAADLAVGLAQKQIHVDASTDQALVRGFAAQMDAAPRGPGADNAGAGQVHADEEGR
jgi:F-type H+-transporting ATPase subunit b